MALIRCGNTKSTASPIGMLGTNPSGLTTGAIGCDGSTTNYTNQSTFTVGRFTGDGTTADYKITSTIACKAHVIQNNTENDYDIPANTATTIGSSAASLVCYLYSI